MRGCGRLSVSSCALCRVRPALSLCVLCVGVAFSFFTHHVTASLSLLLELYVCLCACCLLIFGGSSSKCSAEVLSVQ
jgi:lipoprotein signal peptidase